MTLYFLRIRDFIAEHLSQLENFARPKDTTVFSKSFLSEGEDLHGLYMNSEDDFILFTNTTVHRIKGEKVRSIPYDGIREVDLPKDPDQRALYIHMRGGDTFLLPVSNDTDEYPDFYAVRKFLVSLIYFPHYSDNPEDIEKIQNRDDFEAFLEKQPQADLSLYPSPPFRNLTSTLGDGFPEPWLLDLFKIDPALLDRPDVWRLLALFVCRSCEEPWNGSQAVLPATRATHDIIRAIEIGNPPDAL